MSVRIIETGCKGNKKPKLECAWCNETAYSFISSRQLSVQETGYNILRIRMIKSKEELELLPNNSTDISKKSIIDKYMDRPTCGKFASLETVSLGQFALLYYKITSSNLYHQPNFLEKNIEKENECNTTLLKKSF